MKIKDVAQLEVGAVVITSKRGHQVCITRVSQNAITVDVKNSTDEVILHLVAPVKLFAELAELTGGLATNGA